MIAKSRKKIAFFLPSLKDGGAERVMLNLAQGVATRDEYDVDIVLVQKYGPYLSQVPDTIRIVDLGAARTMSSVLALTRYLRKEKPIALLSALDPANIVAIWARRLAGASTRIVVSEHNTLSHKIENPSKPRGRFIPFFIKRFYPQADGIVAVSNGVANDFAEVTQIPRQKVSVIYNPVITPPLREKAKATLDHPWFKPGEPPVILGVGRLNIQKNFELLIRAFAKVKEDCPARLIILGEGEERNMLEGLVQQLKLEADVSLPGFVDNPYAYMSHSALFTLSSRWEGLPTVLIEALYCGAALVSTDCPSGPPEILAEGKYGKIVPVEDVDALADGMKAALRNGRVQNAEEGWLPYEMDGVVDQYLQLMLGEKV